MNSLEGDALFGSNIAFDDCTFAIGRRFKLSESHGISGSVVAIDGDGGSIGIEPFAGFSSRVRLTIRSIFRYIYSVK
jgi:hypothetical protein